MSEALVEEWWPDDHALPSLQQEPLEVAAQIVHPVLSKENC